MSKVSQPMAPELSSSSGSGAVVQRGRYSEPISSLLDKQERVGNSISFIIPQTPKGKMRHQTVVMTRCGQCQRFVHGQRKECPHCLGKYLNFMRSEEYTPKEQKEYENFVASCALQGMQGKNKYNGPTRVECHFYFCIPKSRESKLRNNDWHTQRPDTDNCVKSIWDALNQVCFADDCLVVQMTAEKRWTTGVPRTEVTITSLCS